MFHLFLFGEFFCKPFEEPVSEQTAVYKRPSCKHVFSLDAVLARWSDSRLGGREGDGTEGHDRKSVQLRREGG